MAFFNFLTGARPALIDLSVRQLLTMLETAGEMFDAATALLLDNEPLQDDLSERDQGINASESAIRRSVLEHVSVAPQEELSFSLILVSVVQEAERCGDLAKNLASIADLADAPRMGGHVEALRPIRDRVASMFPRVRSAFERDDDTVARAVMDEHTRTKLDVADYLRGLASAGDVTANQAVVLATSARMIGRTSSHLSNIISGVALPFDELRNSPS